MAARVQLDRRNAEIKKIWHTLRQVECRTAAYALRYIRRNYFIEKFQIYEVLNLEVDFDLQPEDVSEAFKAVVAE